MEQRPQGIASFSDDRPTAPGKERLLTPGGKSLDCGQQNPQPSDTADRKVTGKGLGEAQHGNRGTVLPMTPDGRHIYSISADDHAIACIGRRRGGESTY